MVSRSTVTKLSNDGYNDPNIQTRLNSLDVSIYERIGNYNETKEKDNEQKNLFIDEDEPHPNEVIDFMEAINILNADNEQYTQAFSEELNDKYIGTKILLLRLGIMQVALVTSRKRSHDGKSLIGRPDAYPYTMLNSLMEEQVNLLPILL